MRLAPCGALGPRRGEPTKPAVRALLAGHGLFASRGRPLARVGGEMPRVPARDRHARKPVRGISARTSSPPPTAGVRGSSGPMKSGPGFWEVALLCAVTRIRGRHVARSSARMRDRIQCRIEQKMPTGIGRARGSVWRGPSHRWRGVGHGPVRGESGQEGSGPWGDCRLDMERKAAIFQVVVVQRVIDVLYFVETFHGQEDQSGLQLGCGVACP